MLEVKSEKGKVDGDWGKEQVQWLSQEAWTENRPGVK